MFISMILDIFFLLRLQSYVYCSLKGFLLAYRNPKLLTSLGEIFYDTCFIHVDVETEFYVFRPEVGCKLKGKACHCNVISRLFLCYEPKICRSSQ